MDLFKTIKKKYNGLTAPLKVVFWFTFVGFLQRGISIITTPIFTRVLTQDEYGMYSVFAAWFDAWVIICTLSIHMGAINNALTKMPYEKNRIIAAFQSVSLVVSGVFLLLAIIFLKDLSGWMDLPKIVVLAMFVGFMFYEPYNDWLIYKRYQYDYKSPVLISIIISIATPIVSIIAIFLFNSARGEARIISFIVVNIIIPGAVFYCVNYKSGRVFFDKKLWTYAIVFNVPLIPHFLSETILNQSDKIMIGSMIGTGDAGVYNIAYSAASLIIIFSSALNIAFVPWQYQTIKNKDYKKLAKVSYAIMGFVGVLLIMLILFSPEIIKVLAGNSYLGAIGLVPILGISVYFNYMYQLFARVELYYEKKIYTVFATLGATILNVALNFWWIPQMGYAGASYSTLIAHMFLCVIHFLFYKKICRDNNINESFYQGKIILLISVVFIICSLAVIPLYGYLGIRIGIVLFFITLIFSFRKSIKEIIIIIRDNK